MSYYLKGVGYLSSNHRVSSPRESCSPIDPIDISSEQTLPIDENVKNELKKLDAVYSQFREQAQKIYQSKNGNVMVLKQNIQNLSANISGALNLLSLLHK